MLCFLDDGEGMTPGMMAQNLYPVQKANNHGLATSAVLIAVVSVGRRQQFFQPLLRNYFTYWYRNNYPRLPIIAIHVLTP